MIEEKIYLRKFGIFFGVLIIGLLVNFVGSGKNFTANVSSIVNDEMKGAIIDLDNIDLTLLSEAQPEKILLIAEPEKADLLEGKIKEEVVGVEIERVEIPENPTRADLVSFAYKLAENHERELLVLGLEFEGNDFQKAFARNVIENVDKFGARNVFAAEESQQALMVLFSYLDKLGALKSEVAEESFNAVFWEGANASSRRLYVMGFGDMMLGRYVRTLMDKHGKDYIFEKMPNMFTGADIVFGNLEGPIKGQGFNKNTGMVFGFNEDIAPFLKQKGFSLLSIANNHATDQGWDGYETTKVALDQSGLGWCGHPSEPKEDSVYYQTLEDNKKFAFVCLHDVTYKLDYDAAVKLVEKVNLEADFVLISIHWGYEYTHQPHDKKQVELARRLIDAGGDFIIGHHPHVVQTFEEYNGKLIFYSLGNFVFDQYWSKETQEELAIGIELSESEASVYLFPMKSEKSQSRLMSEEERKEWIERFIKYGNYSDDLKNQIRGGKISL